MPAARGPPYVRIMSRVRLVLAVIALVLVAALGVEIARTVLEGPAPGRPAVSTVATAAHRNGELAHDQLVEISDGHMLLAPAAEAFSELRAAAAAAGHTMTVNSAYRDLAEQAALIERYGLLADGGRAAALGESEHGDGTCVDLTLDTDALIWMRENAPGHGFHETITDEPWHWNWSRP